MFTKQMQLPKTENFSAKKEEEETGHLQTPMGP